MKIKRVLIANRGEIARRIGETAKRLGIEPAIFLEENIALPKYLAPIVPYIIRVKEENVALYLNKEELIRVAKEHECNAIHPGFGFLSENSEFAKACFDEKIIWVGPHHESIFLMADKGTAKDIARKVLVPCLEAIEGYDPKASGAKKKLNDFISKHNFPLLVKAALGGGGKGMRILENADEVTSLIERASSEALKSFGDGKLMIEPYLLRPRHVEVQVLGDKHGNIIALADRDCSIQRRHQKIIEEAPAYDLSDELRWQLSDAAVKIAQEVKYDSCGTVEFLVVENKNKKSFYFLEMNTRLQVEHPVTEELFGMDLVEEQFLIAMGEKISKEILKFDTAKRKDYADFLTRHSIEARVYAEDSYDPYLPCPGKVEGFIPYQGKGIRWEIGMDNSDEVTTKFDPMIAKVIATGKTRKEAMERLLFAIENTVLGTEKNNLSLISVLCEMKDFQDFKVHTFYLKDHQEEIKKRLDEKYATKKTSEEKVLLSNTHEDIHENLLKNIFYHDVNKKLAYKKTKRRDSISSINASSGDSSHQVESHVPGKVFLVLVKPGEKVTRGQKLIVLESMKMEIEIKAQRDGVVDEILVTVGEQVASGKVLLKWRNK